MKVGIIKIFYDDKNNIDFIIGYSKETGYFKTRHLENIPNNLIWFSNLIENSKYINIKNLNFFNFSEDRILYYFGISECNIKEKLKRVLELYKNILRVYNKYYYKIEEKDLLKINSFDRLFIRNKKLFNNRFKESYKENIVFLNELDIKKYRNLNLEVKGNYFLYLSKYSIIKELEEKYFPLGFFKKISLESIVNESKNKSWFDYLNDKKFYYVKANIIDIKPFYKNIIGKENLEKHIYLNNEEISFLFNKIKLEVEEIIISNKRIKLKELMRKTLDIKENNLAVEIFSNNYLEALIKEKHVFINNLIFSYQKLSLYNAIEEFSNNNIDVTIYGNSEIVISVNESLKKKAIEISEKYNLIYPIELIK